MQAAANTAAKDASQERNALEISKAERPGASPNQGPSKIRKKTSGNKSTGNGDGRSSSKGSSGAASRERKTSTVAIESEKTGDGRSSSKGHSGAASRERKTSTVAIESEKTGLKSASDRDKTRSSPSSDGLSCESTSTPNPVRSIHELRMSMPVLCCNQEQDAYVSPQHWDSQSEAFTEDPAKLSCLTSLSNLNLTKNTSARSPKASGSTSFLRTESTSDASCSQTQPKLRLLQLHADTAPMPDLPEILSLATPVFSCTFRFVMYNMANVDLDLNDVGSGFVLLREQFQKEAEAATLDEAKKNNSSSSHPLTPLGSAGTSVLNSSSTSGVKSNLFSLMIFGIVRPPMLTFARQSRLQRGKASVMNLVRAFTGQFASSWYKRHNTGSVSASVSSRYTGTSTRSSSALPGASMQCTELGSLDYTYGSPTRDRAATSPGDGSTTRPPNGTVDGMRSPTGRGMKTTATNRSTRLRCTAASARSSTPHRMGPNVDYVFGVFCETKFPISDYARMHGIYEHFHAISALQMLSERGVIEGMKGKTIGAFNGDLKAFLLGSAACEMVARGKIFCSFDRASQGVSKGNPVKSFLGQSFTTADGAVRFVCLGTHFPMQKVSSLMEDSSMSEDEALQKVKCLVARCLQKILRHLLQENLIDSKTVIILQGDLNSRCLRNEGTYMDSLTEALEDVRLQEFISADLPQELRGEWREVVPCSDAGDLPVTYRFERSRPPVVDACKINLREVFSFEPSDMQLTYTQVLAKIKTNGTLDGWGLYGHKLEGDAVCPTKFKPSRLPAATERVLFYAPASFQDRCLWETSLGYEVNYLQTGSDHKPVTVDATFKLYSAATVEQALNGKKFSAGPSATATPSSRPPSFNPRRSQVPVDFQKRYLSHDHEEDHESDDSADGDEVAELGQQKAAQSPNGQKTSLLSTIKRSCVMPRSRTGLRLSMNGDMQNGLMWK